MLFDEKTIGDICFVETHDLKFNQRVKGKNKRHKLEIIFSEVTKYAKKINFDPLKNNTQPVFTL